jgi:hypothetical protein
MHVHPCTQAHSKCVHALQTIAAPRMYCDELKTHMVINSGEPAKLKLNKTHSQLWPPERLMSSGRVKSTYQFKVLRC